MAKILNQFKNKTSRTNNHLDGNNRALKRSISGVKVDIYDVIEVIETIEWNPVTSYYRHTVGHQHTYRRPKYIKKDVSIRNYIGYLINNRCDLNGNHYYNIIYHIFINNLLFIYLCMPDFRL